MAQRITLLGEVIYTTDTPLHMAQPVTLLGEVISTTIYTFTYGPAGNFIRRSHPQRITFLGEHTQIHLYIWPSG